jgi:hypothetical protein
MQVPLAFQPPPGRFSSISIACFPRWWACTDHPGRRLQRGESSERASNGVLIDDGLVLTISYLITEAETVWLISATAGWWKATRSIDW